MLVGPNRANKLFIIEQIDSLAYGKHLPRSGFGHSVRRPGQFVCPNRDSVCPYTYTQRLRGLYTHWWKVAGEQVFAGTSRQEYGANWVLWEEFEGRPSSVHDRRAHNHDFVSLTTTATCTAYGVLVCRATS